MMPSSGIGPESFDLLKEYLSSAPGQQTDIHQLIASINTGFGAAEAPAEGAPSKCVTSAQ